MSFPSNNINAAMQAPTLPADTTQKPPLWLAVGSPIGDAFRKLGYPQDLFEPTLQGEVDATQAMQLAIKKKNKKNYNDAIEHWKTFRSMLNGALGIGKTPRTKPTVRTDDANGFPFMNRCNQALANHLYQRGGFPLATPSTLARIQEMLGFGLTFNDEPGSRIIRSALRVPGMNVHYLQDTDGTPMLPFAAEKEYKNTIKTLLEIPGMNVNQAGPDGQTALHWAASHGNSDTLGRLLEAGADPNLTNAEGLTPLHFASKSHHLRIVLRLLNAGANPNLADNGGVTPLHFASVENQLEIVQALVDAEANPNLATHKGFTPLHMAVHHGNLEVIKELLANGADPNQIDRKGRSAIVWAKVAKSLAKMNSASREDQAKANEIVKLFKPYHPSLMQRTRRHLQAMLYMNLFPSATQRGKQ